MSRFNNAPYDSFCSSPEILQAISVVAGEEYDPPEDCTAEERDDYDMYSTFHRIWRDPSEEEAAQVAIVAWHLAASDEATLNWGQETLRRD